ncbi:MAG: CopG family transcriptional regulator [Acidobacteria bacterium]|nr:CopG family transcriptional regulator [Acidobacteriota bacterium]
MIRTQISFDAKLYEAARREAGRRRISLSEMCRRALRDALADVPTTAPWMRYAGAVASGDPNASDTVDVVVYGREEP